MTALTPSIGGVEAVLSAYRALAEGDPAPVLELLAPDVEWWSQGVRVHLGREEVALVFTRLRSEVQLTGVRKGGSVVVFEFARPWWKHHRMLYAVSASIGFRAEQAVRMRDGKIRKIETREHVLPEPSSA